MTDHNKNTAMTIITTAIKYVLLSIVLSLLLFVNPARSHEKLSPVADTMLVTQAQLPVSDSVYYMYLGDELCIMFKEQNAKYRGMTGELQMLSNSSSSVIYLFSFRSNRVTRQAYRKLLDTCKAECGKPFFDKLIDHAYQHMQWKGKTLDGKQHFLIGLEYNIKKHQIHYYKINKKFGGDPAPKYEPDYFKGAYKHK